MVNCCLSLYACRLNVCFSVIGEGDEKGKITGIVRSLGALARSFGPLLTCGGEVDLCSFHSEKICCNFINKTCKQNKQTPVYSYQ